MISKKETLEVLNDLKAGFPLFYVNVGDEFMPRVVNVWHSHLSGYSYERIQKAVFKLTDIEERTPTIATLIKYINSVPEITVPNGYGSIEEWEKKKAELRR